VIDGMKNKIIILIIIFIFIINIFNGCIEDKDEEEKITSSIVKNLYISPKITIPNQPINISIDIENLNNSKMEETVYLKWDNGEKLSKKIYLSSYETKTISWEISEYETGFYNFSIEDLNGSYIISDKIAWFKINNLYIQSEEIEIDEITNISVIIENIGFVSDFYNLELYVDENLEQTKNIKINIGEKKNVSFKFMKPVLGKYNIEIDNLKDEIYVVNFKQIDFKYPLVDEPLWKIIISTDYNMFEINWKCDEIIKIEIYDIFDNKMELIHKSQQGQNDGSTKIIVGEKQETLKTTIYGLIIKDIYDKILFKTKKEFISGIIDLSIANVSTIYTDVEIEWAGSESSFPIWICFLRFYIDEELIEEKTNINWVFHNPINTIYDKRIYHYGQSIERGFHEVKIILRDCFSNKFLTFSDEINYP
jgi:hypothetical protein